MSCTNTPIGVDLEVSEKCFTIKTIDRQWTKTCDYAKAMKETAKKLIKKKKKKSL